MPAWIAGCAWTGKVGGPTSSSPTITVNPTAPPCGRGTFAYHGIAKPPTDDNYDAWYALVKATVQHAVDRYGIDEVRSWSFEVWNELWGMPFPREYMKLYNYSSHAVKAVDPQIKVGGPATADLEDVSTFRDMAVAAKAPFDFVSTHHYPSDPTCPHGDNWDPDCFANNVLRSRATVADTPFYLTEYNVGCCLGYSQHDTPAAAAFAFRQVGALSQKLDVMSYWTFTDVFEEGGFPDTEYKNIYGSMTKDGVPKPVWRAFQLMHAHAGDTEANTTVGPQGQPAPTPADELAPADQCAQVPATMFAGNDILPDSQHLNVPDAAACCAACQNHTGTNPETKCWVWSFGHNDSSCCKNRCYLKTLHGDEKRSHSSQFTSGYAGAAPPPPPPPGPKKHISAFATLNATEAGSIGSLRVFLGYWGNPDQDESNPPANRTVTVTVHHAAGTALPANAKLYIIGNGAADSQKRWRALGSPQQPTAEQLQQLMAASQIGTGIAAVTVAGPTTATVAVEMSENSAIVVAMS